MADMASESQLQALLNTGDNYDKWLLWLKSIRPRYVGTPMLAKIDAQIAKGESTRSSIGTVLTSVRDAWAWLKTQGTGALDALKQATGLGFLPAIPAVWLYGLGATAVAGALTTMGYWIGEASNLKKELDIFDATVARATEAGADPIMAVNAAAAAVTGTVKGDSDRVSASAQGTVGQIVTLIKWGGAAFVAYKIAKHFGWLPGRA